MTKAVMWRTELGYSTGTVCAPRSWAIFPAPNLVLDYDLYCSKSWTRVPASAMAFIVGCTCLAHVLLVEPQGRRYTGNGNTLVLYIKYIVPIMMLFPELHAHSLAMFPASVMSIPLIKSVHLQLALSYGQSLFLIITSLLKYSVYFT